MDTHLPHLASLLQAAFKDHALQAKFVENGYVILETELPEESLDVVTDFWMDNIDQYASSRYISTIELSNTEHRIATNRLYHDVTKGIVNEFFIDYEQFYGGFGVKFNRDTTALEPHQDTTMVPYEGNRTGLTLWTPLIDVDTDNGCVQVIPCSHKYNRLPRATGCDFAYQPYMKEILEQMVPVPLKRGQVLVTDQSLIHCSGPNRSKYVRVAVMGMIKPREESLVYYHPLDNSCSALEVFEVPIDFYTYHMLTTRPQNLRVSKIIQNTAKPYIWFR